MQLKSSRSWARCRTVRLRQAGAVMSDCQPRGDPGLACSRIVKRSHSEPTTPTSARTRPRNGTKSNIPASIFCQESPRRSTGTSSTEATEATPPMTIYQRGSRQGIRQRQSRIRDKMPLPTSLSTGCSCFFFIEPSSTTELTGAGPLTCDMQTEPRPGVQ